MDKVGLIGYGAMGTAFAERLCISPEVDLSVYDIDEKANQRAKDNGLTVASSIAELAKRCDILDFIVRTDVQMLEAAIGPEGALSTARPGTIFLLHSSIHPDTTREIAKVAADLDVEVADACPGGQPDNIREGKLVFLLGADKQLADKIEHHLLRMARAVLHMGPLAAGNTAKIMRTIVQTSECLVLWEMLRLGEAAGISYVNTLEMMRFTETDLQSLIDHWERWFDPSGNNSLMRPDGRYEHVIPVASALAHAYGLDLPIAEQLATEALRASKLNEGRTWPPQ